MIRTFASVVCVAAFAGCLPGAKSAAAEGTAIEGAFSCKGAEGKSWKATFSSTKIDECAVKTKDQILDLRIGTLEDGLIVHVVDFSGSGQYQIGGASGSKVSVVAKGGVGDATSTTVDTTSAEPCAAKCTLDVADAGDKLSIDLSCPKLTRVDGGACVTCTPARETFVKANGIACRKD